MTPILLAATAPGLTPAGWALMLGCIGLVCGLAVVCYTLILREPEPSEHHHAPLDIDTRDDDG